MSAGHGWRRAAVISVSRISSSSRQAGSSLPSRSRSASLRRSPARPDSSLPDVTREPRSTCLMSRATSPPVDRQTRPLQRRVEAVDGLPDGVHLDLHPLGDPVGGGDGGDSGGDGGGDGGEGGGGGGRRYHGTELARRILQPGQEGQGEHAGPGPGYRQAASYALAEFECGGERVGGRGRRGPAGPGRGRGSAGRAPPPSAAPRSGAVAERCGGPPQAAPRWSRGMAYGR